MHFNPLASIVLVVSFLTPMQAIAQQNSKNDPTKTYGVRELVHILNKQPNFLKWKRIRLEAVAVDATKGMGCDSGSTLIDKGDLAEYKRLHNDAFNRPELFEKLNAIPRIETGPTVGIPIIRPIRATKAQIDELRPTMAVPSKTNITHNEYFPVSVVPSYHAAIYNGHFFDEALMKHCGKESWRRIMLDSVVRSSK